MDIILGDNVTPTNDNVDMVIVGLPRTKLEQLARIEIASRQLVEWVRMMAPTADPQRNALHILGSADVAGKGSDIVAYGTAGRIMALEMALGMRTADGACPPETLTQWPSQTGKTHEC